MERVCERLAQRYFARRSVAAAAPLRRCSNGCICACSESRIAGDSRRPRTIIATAPTLDFVRVGVTRQILGRFQPVLGRKPPKSCLARLQTHLLLPLCLIVSHVSLFPCCPLLHFAVSVDNRKKMRGFSSLREISAKRHGSGFPHQARSLSEN